MVHHGFHGLFGERYDDPFGFEKALGGWVGEGGGVHNPHDRSPRPLRLAQPLRPLVRDSIELEREGEAWGEA